MARVKCVTMQRDEDMLLEPWLRYYGYLFGFENLCVFDNNSTHAGVIATLQFYERLGVEIHWDHKAPSDYVGKGGHFRNIIAHWDHLGDYDFALPVECDEFLALFTPGGVTCTRSLIHAHFDALIGARAPLVIDLALNNVPDRPGWFWPQHRPKRFLAAGTVGEIDQRQAAIRTAGDEDSRMTEFAYLHAHYKPLEALQRHARQKLEYFHDDVETLTGRGYDGPRPDLAAHLDLTEASYAASFADKLLVEVPDLSLLLEGLGIADNLLVDPAAEPSSEGCTLRLPKRRARDADHFVRFDPVTYRESHADLANSETLALKHYLVFGHAEGRTI